MRELVRGPPISKLEGREWTLSRWTNGLSVAATMPVQESMEGRRAAGTRREQGQKGQSLKNKGRTELVLSHRMLT